MPKIVRKKAVRSEYSNQEEEEQPKVTELPDEIWAEILMHFTCSDLPYKKRIGYKRVSKKWAEILGKMEFFNGPNDLECMTYEILKQLINPRKRSTGGGGGSN
jgi:hypothetical protein